MNPLTDTNMMPAHSPVLVANRQPARLRKIERSDLPAIEHMERDISAGTVTYLTASNPLTASNIVALHDAGWTIMVAVEPGIGRVVGYIVYGLIEMKRVSIERFAVSPDFRRHGVGRQLVLHAVQCAVEIMARDVAADVPQSELAAQSLMRHCSFRVPRCMAQDYGKSATQPYHFVRSLS